VFAELLADRLEGICQLTPQQLNEFQAHYELLMRWNRVLNLTALGNLEDVVDRHYCESIFLALHLPPGPITVADIGSGGGFPGFPVAVLRTDSVVSLIESHRRKAVFLRESSRRLHNIRVIGKRVQEVDEVFEWGRKIRRNPNGSKENRSECRITDWRSVACRASRLRLAAPDPRALGPESLSVDWPQCFTWNAKRFGDSIAGLGRVIAVANQKGGVGKTTTAINLSASLAANDFRVLLVDSDPQGNATTGVGISKDSARPTLYQVLLGGTDLSEAIVKTQFDGLDLVPADKNLIGANLELIDFDGREFRLQEKTRPIRDRYQFILIDCPPALDLLTLNALIAADTVLVPIQCEFFALEGISELMDTIDRVRESFQHPLQVEGILLTMYDDRTNLTRQVAADLREFFGNQVFQTVIPRSIRLAEAPSHGKPVLSYDLRSRGAESYIKLAKEMLENEQNARNA
jgi:chromosome partitioning protein